MKKILLLLLFTGSLYAQKQVFNVQKYCIDETPFKAAQCDVSGTEYSFVYLDTEKKSVVFFLAGMRLEYAILQSVAYKPGTTYTLENANGQIEMKVNKGKTRIEFLYPDKHIYLTVGKSTKAGS